MTSRALVLGGGGPVGIAWECGLVVGLAKAGVVLADADLVVGTSAGSVVGAHLKLGTDLAAAVSAVGDPLPVVGGAGLAALQDAMATAGAGAASPEAGRAALGSFALAAATVDEASFVATAAFAAFAGVGWPAGFRCTAVDVATGEFRVWDAASGVALDRAVASSCSVPGVFPPVTIDGERYMDGGMRTGLNADVAVGATAAIAISCFALEAPEGFSNPMLDALNAQVGAELAALRAGGATLAVVVPGAEFLDISGWGMFLMDPSRAGIAYEAGLRQAAVEADRLAEVWTA